VSEETLLRMGQTSRQGINLSLQHRYRNRRDGDSFATIETLSVDDGFNSMRLAMKHDVREWIVQGLSRRHRLIVVLYYYEDMSMREIGDTLGDERIARQPAPRHDHHPPAASSAGSGSGIHRALCVARARLPSAIFDVIGRAAARGHNGSDL
jgi:hypothetical protein